MKKHVYVFRHGQTDLNLSGVWQGSGVDAELNENGKRQVEMLSDKVKWLGLEKLYSSPLLRAVQTANRIAQKSLTPMDIVIMQDLREVHFGDCDGQRDEVVRIRYGNEFVYNFLWATKETWNRAFANGECKHRVFHRVLECLKRAVKEKENTIGIVCHAGVISSLACGFGLKDVSYENCAILHLVYDTETGLFSQEQ